MVAGGGGEIMVGSRRSWIVAAKLCLVVGSHGWSWVVLDGRTFSNAPYIFANLSMALLIKLLLLQKSV